MDDRELPIRTGNAVRATNTELDAVYNVLVQSVNDYAIYGVYSLIESQSHVAVPRTPVLATGAFPFSNHIFEVYG